MKSLHLGDVEDFPFLESPAPRMIADGYNLLAELGALDETTKELTQVGRELAKLPLDPKIGRMILAAREHNCLREVLIIASALGTQDPRDRPQEHAATADQAHAKWKDEKSEFLSYLKLWAAGDEIWKHETSNKQRQWCRQNFINWLRLREWRDVHAQLMTLCHEHGWKITSAYPPAPAPRLALHSQPAAAAQSGALRNPAYAPREGVTTVRSAPEIYDSPALGLSLIHI